jgi:hypothetical protein
MTMTSPRERSEAAREAHKWVYVFRAAHGVKVGITGVDVEMRRRGIEMAAGVEVELVAAFAVPRHRAGVVEMSAHRALAEQRTLGEWFSSSPAEAVAAVRAAIEHADLTPRPHVPREPQAEPVHPLVALAELGGRATLNDLRSLLGGHVGYRLRALRNRGFLAAWTDVLILTEAGWAEAARLREGGRA